MKKQSLEILHRYRNHLLEKEQIALQDKIADENEQKARLLQLQARIKATHEAKLKSTSAEELSCLDDAAAYLHGRMTLAKRAVQLTGVAREEALARTLKAKQSRDQIGLLMEKQRVERLRQRDDAERKQTDELVTSRYAMTAGGL